MGLLDIFKRKKNKRGGRRNYDAAGSGRLLSDWQSVFGANDSSISYSLEVLRGRSRDLFRNNDYAKKYGEMVKTNVIGAKGIVMQSKAKDQTGRFDKLDNQLVESAWKKWGNKKNCSITTSLSWIDLQRVAIETVARDGEVLIRIIKGADNPFGFALQLIESDYLRQNYNVQQLDNGNKVVMGVELNDWGAPMAYHLGGSSEDASVGTHISRIPADEMIHLFVSNRPGQIRGVPWLHSAMTRLHQIGKYEEAEVIAARIGACKMGFFKPGDDGDIYVGVDTDETTGATITEATPGGFETLPQGMDFEAFDPQHPSGNFAPFIKSSLRGVASGLNVSYNSLASDLEGVNFSSIRSGVLEERQNWRVIQKWMIDHFHQEVYTAWLPYAILNGQLGTIPQQRIEKFANPNWQPRGWEWVDPLKDAKANLEELKMGTKSRADILADKGKDIEEVFDQLREENELAKSVGIDINAVDFIEEIDVNEQDD